MARDFDGKVAFITGAAHGQGRAVALALASAGARIAGYDIARQIDYPGYKLGTAEDLSALEREAAATGTEALVFAGDVRSDADIRTAVARTMERFGRIDILFNNAGICFYGQSHELSEEAWGAM